MKMVFIPLKQRLDRRFIITEKQWHLRDSSLDNSFKASIGLKTRVNPIPNYVQKIDVKTIRLIRQLSFQLKKMLLSLKNKLSGAVFTLHDPHAIVELKEDKDGSPLPESLLQIQMPWSKSL